LNSGCARVRCEPYAFLNLLSHLGPHEAPPIFYTESEAGARVFYLFGSGYTVITETDSESFVARLRDVSAIVPAVSVEL
jgi:hypothetical protein